MNRDEILVKLSQILEELFGVMPETVRTEARLYEDLDLDSIDAIDLVLKLQALTGKRIAPEEFKAVRTVSDVVDCVERLLASDEKTVA